MKAKKNKGLWFYRFYLDVILPIVAAIIMLSFFSVMGAALHC